MPGIDCPTNCRASYKLAKMVPDAVADLQSEGSNFQLGSTDTRIRHGGTRGHDKFKKIRTWIQ